MVRFIGVLLRSAIIISSVRLLEEMSAIDAEREGAKVSAQTGGYCGVQIERCLGFVIARHLS
ncbi:MAG: hypothetical protein BGN91_03400 [Nitrobacter sp. 62-13]|nr:MAG: hypothetical protein BGN91_03400 [Nitrobacter sp. 62-13]